MTDNQLAFVNFTLDFLAIGNGKSFVEHCTI